MIEEAHQDLQTFVTGESFVKIAIRFFSLEQNREISLPFCPRREYKFGSCAFRANLIEAE